MVTAFFAALGLFLATAAALAGRVTPKRAAAAPLSLLAVGATGAAAWTGSRHRRAASAGALVAAVPGLGRPEQGYVSSSACRSCHPSQHESWRRSFHRTMTTLATPETVRAPFGGESVSSRGRTYRLDRRGDEFWADLVDPDWERDQRLAGRDPDDSGDAPLVSRRVVMVTGSHHMQTYWVAGGHGNEVYNLPFVFLYERDAWVPREDVFLRPPTAGRFFAVWNNSCIECHSTAGKVGFQLEQEVFRSSVAELGIACEACHGPAAAHVEANRSPWRRYRLHLTGAPDPTIVQPARLSQKASGQVCGQCHGVSLPDPMDWLQHGHRFRPGQDLEASRVVVRPASAADSAPLRELVARDPAALPSRFWADGMVRVSGREYNAMIESACYRKGDLTCLSCHSMHASEPDDQLAVGREGDGACLQCHERYASAGPAHTHHSAGSQGSRCANCHMPHTTYGLLKAIRSHWIDSPTAASTLRTGRPNACNLCHLDRTLAWTGEHLGRWYGQPRPPLGDDQQRYSAALLALMRGEAGQRALAAWSFGWAPAQAASGRGWMAPYLAHLLEDPYATVRYIAARSLRTLPGYEGFDFDFIAAPDTRSRARRRALDVWFDLPASRVDRKGESVLIDANGDPLHGVLARLAAERDDRPVVLSE
jgi:predicted CXXCH cytochrome family protein